MSGNQSDSIICLPTPNLTLMTLIHTHNSGSSSFQTQAVLLRVSEASPERTPISNN